MWWLIELLTELILLLRELQSLLRMATNNLASLWRLHLQDLQGRAAIDIRYILRCDEDELSVWHGLSNLDESVNDKFSGDWIELKKGNEKERKQVLQ